MKHAGSDALDRLEPLLAQIRQRAALKENRAARSIAAAAPSCTSMSTAKNSLPTCA